VIKSLEVTAFTVFNEAKFKFGKNLNVIVGENGAAKTHILKLAYSILATSFEEGRKPGAAAPTKSLLQTRLAEKLVNVFRPESLGRLAQRRQGVQRCEVTVMGTKQASNVAFGFTTKSTSEVSIQTLPKEWVTEAPAYLPTRELLTIYPGFVPIYEGHYLEFEETWRDTCLLLGAPLRRGVKAAGVAELLAPLNEAMDGTIELDKNGRFYFVSSRGRMEMPLVAEGLRKLAMLARLIATGALLDKGALFWDEPEANLNPKLIKKVAQSIVDLSAAGIQVFIATHSLFLLRELELRITQAIHARFFGLHQQQDEVVVEQGASIDDIGSIAALDEELEQSQRYLDQGA
jgi:energy-coupling factor transporter ATP-binding protein EcfA2